MHAMILQNSVAESSSSPTILSFLRENAAFPPAIFSKPEDRGSDAAAHVTKVGIKEIVLDQGWVTPLHRSTADKVIFVQCGQLAIFILSEDAGRGEWKRWFKERSIRPIFVF